MNWNTKAKTRVGKNKNKDDIQNSKRLAAWSKLPNKRTGQQRHIELPIRQREVINATNFGGRKKTSGDLMMLGEMPSNVTSNRPCDTRNQTRDKANHHARSRSTSREKDPLVLLQFTVCVFKSHRIYYDASLNLNDTLCLHF
jgi:hypothetical protein